MVKVYSGKPLSVPKKTGKGKGEFTKTSKKKAMKCHDGPYEGHTLYLIEPSTCVFSVGGFKGRYVYVHWQDM